MLLGDLDLAHCRPTVETLQVISPLGAGYCTQAAWADQNPGYETDAVPAPPLKHVLVSIGAGCK